MKEKRLRVVLILISFLFVGIILQAEPPTWQSKQMNQPAIGYGKPKAPLIKGATKLNVSFQVINSSFNYVVVGNVSAMKIDINFNKNVDQSSINWGHNFRVLRRGQDGFWRDSYQDPGTMQVSGSHITWQSNGWANEGPHKLHLGGTLKGTGGQFLDCDNDGKGEGGYPPPYESEIFYCVL
ncbi:MAG: hypothetical protein GY858_09665 [Candidatus Omnitrophica bacterium]|nr:hypothetical protein [Candidatus Omnitrophota bacterium]